MKKAQETTRPAVPRTAWDRREWALREPLPKRANYEHLDQLRLELFRQLEIVTQNDDKRWDDWATDEIQNIANRLTQITLKRPTALRSAIKAGRLAKETKIKKYRY